MEEILINGSKLGSMTVTQILGFIVVALFGVLYFIIRQMIDQIKDLQIRYNKIESCYRKTIKQHTEMINLINQENTLKIEKINKENTLKFERIIENYNVNITEIMGAIDNINDSLKEINNRESPIDS